MDLYDTYIGNTADEAVASRVERAATRELTLDETTRRRSRFRTETEDGTDVGVVTGKAGSLEPGDVLASDDAAALLVVGLAARDALVVDLHEADATPEAMALAAKLGHVVGNRHRDLAVRGASVLVALDESVERHREEVAAHLPDGATTRVEAVDPMRFDDGTPDHAHGDDHVHEHGDTHEHDHGNATGVRAPNPDGGESK
ncbi:hypothetical protein GCM10009037_23940 [Halarchaeum grantii]|uniref:UreE urease accessory N-terminal domain-containing protein n=1 Tax=Halarchaeum grantii TaxID=1193105 RepID=A0A830EXL3_9EURY|nr:urease accessory protein UreE [Halarchaeum grantii]GGL39390.1 hypothetical protein GCM10009037_23940 [Halarchaeum grantii]